MSPNAREDKVARDNPPTHLIQERVHYKMYGPYRQRRSVVKAPRLSATTLWAANKEGLRSAWLGRTRARLSGTYLAGWSGDQSARKGKVMRRAQSIVGLPIISLAEGLRVGKVHDIVLDPDKRSIAALVLSEASWRHDAVLVPLDQIRSFGQDAVTIYNLSGVVKAKSQPALHQLLTSGVKLDGLLVMTEGGNYLGILEEIIVGPRGEMLSYEISGGFAEDVNRGKYLLPADEALTVGHDVATFPEGSETYLTRAEEQVVAVEAPTGSNEVRVFQPVNHAVG